MASWNGQAFGTIANKARKNEPPKRWEALISYKRDKGSVVEIHRIEELSDLEEIVESGPDWNCIGSIVVVLNEKRRTHDLTVEQAEAI